MTETSGIVERAVKTTGPFEKKFGVGAMRVHVWSQDDRTKRALKRLALCWVAAPVVMFVPPHFPWLTLALISGPITAWLAYRSAGTIQAGTVPCPECGNAVAIEEQPERWPIGARCKACRNIFSVEPA